MFENLPLSTAQEVCDSSSGVTPCIVMKDDGALYHQVSSFSPECWMKVVLQEHAVVGSVYCLPWRYSMVQYYPIVVIHAVVAPRKFRGVSNVLQVCGNLEYHAECGAKFCNIL